MRKVATLGLALASLASGSYAQAPTPGASPPPDGKHSGAPLAQFTIGPVVVTPTFRIGSLAVDTNVQFQSDRRTDFLASAGPGLDIALPFLDHWKVDVQGTSQYFYFHRTKELRRWTGGGAATLLWATTGTRASMFVSANREFSRPNFEVDARVASRQDSLGVTFERDLGRLTLALKASLAANKVDQGQEFRGADLSTALTTDRYTLTPELHYRLTPLTALLLEGTYEKTRFPKAPSKDFHQESAGAGFLFKGLLKGHVTAGSRRSRLSDGSGPANIRPYLRANLSQQLGRRFRLAETYSQDSTVSAFAADGNLPTFESRRLTLELGITITGRMDLRLSGTQEKIKSDGLVNVILDDGSRATAKRDDVAYVAIGDLGIRLGHARVGLFTSYTTRESLYFSDFGIEGVQAGARVEYAPK